MKNTMLKFMDERQLCVISTVGVDSKPESAMVAYIHDGLELYIGTSNKSRKFQNLLTNPAVAVVIADESGEVQYEAQAQTVDKETISNVPVEKLPGFEKYRNDPSQVYLHLKPTWVRFIQHGDVDQIEEWSF